MAEQRKVLCASEHIPQLAEGLYSNWRSLWKKNSALAAKRKNPLILFHGDRNGAYRKPNPNNSATTLPGAPGDTVVLPDATKKEESGATDSHHPFQANNDTVYLRLRVLDEEFQALKDATWQLVVDGVKFPADQAEGAFESGGMINVEVPKTAQVGKLTVWFPPPSEPAATTPSEGAGTTPPAGGTGATPETNAPSGGSTAVLKRASMIFWLQIGRLDPILEPAPDNWCTAGVQQRLNNLGFESGPVDGMSGPITKAAVRRFQTKCKITVDGLAGQQTQGKLREIHDQPGVPPAPAESGTGGGSPAPAAPPPPSPSGSTPSEDEEDSGGDKHPTGQEVVDIGNSKSGGSYDKTWQGTGVPEAVLHKGSKVLEKDPYGSYCCGYTFWVVMKTAQQYKLIEDKSYAQIRTFQQEWYGATSSSKEQQVAIALPNLGIGEAIAFDQAQPGDFCQFWRGQTGHSVLFLGFAEENGQKVGIKYRSSQDSTGGIGDRTEYFKDAAGKSGQVDRNRTYFARITPK